MRVTDILKVFRYKYGSKADLVCVNRQTMDTEAFNIMKTILEEQTIPIEIDDRVAVGKFMFINRELAASNLL